MEAWVGRAGPVRDKARLCTGAGANRAARPGGHSGPSRCVLLGQQAGKPGCPCARWTRMTLSQAAGIMQKTSTPAREAARNQQQGGRVAWGQARPVLQHKRHNMHAIWRFLQDFGVTVPRPRVMAAALALLLVCLTLGVLLALAGENPFLLATIGQGEPQQIQELIAYGLNAQSVGSFSIYGLGLAWVMAGGAGARLIWMGLLLVGGFVFAAFHGLALYLHDGPWPVGMLIARGVLCLGLLAGTAMLFAPEVTAWRKRLLAQRNAQREARLARHQAKQG